MQKRAVPSPPRTPPKSSSSRLLSTQTSPASQSTSFAPHAADQRAVTPPEIAAPRSKPDEIPAQTSAADQTPRAAEWLMPTSGELAFLASLPRPTVDVDDGTIVEQTAESKPEESSSDTTGNTDATTAWPNSESIFAASSRNWTGTKDGVRFNRQDTWAVGEKWGRHIRVFEVVGSATGAEGRDSPH